MSNKRIVIEATARTPHSVELVGEEYLVTPPKSTLALALASRVAAAGEDPGKIREEVDIWVRLAFGRKQSAKVLERLEDADDDLDLPHIMQLMQALAEAATADPSL